MTVADKLREIAEEFPGHSRGVSPMPGCFGCELEHIANSLESKAAQLVKPDLLEAIVLGSGSAAKDVQRIGYEIGKPKSAT